MSHHVAVSLPDGRGAMADYRHPVVHVMQRINQRLMTMNRADAQAESTEDYAILGRWLDNRPDEACTHAYCTLHGPASPDHYVPPPYREGTLF